MLALSLNFLMDATLCAAKAQPYEQQFKSEVDYVTAQILDCKHCGARNVVTACDTCNRHFVVTMDHLSGQPRSFESPGICEIPANLPTSCDFCKASSPMHRVSAGLQQRTCAGCHTEFLSGHGL